MGELTFSGRSPQATIYNGSCIDIPSLLLLRVVTEKDVLDHLTDFLNEIKLQFNFFH